jgi:hypothetical protein
MLGMTGQQLSVVGLLLLILVLVIGVMLAFAFGFFKGSVSLTPSPPMQEQAIVTTSLEATQQLAGTSEPGFESLAVSETATSPVFEHPTPVTPSLTGVAQASPTISNTATITATPPADVCAQLDLRFLAATSNVVQWRLQNSSGIDLELMRAQIDWPQANDAIFNVFLGGTAIWSSQDLVPPTIISTWLGTPADRRVNGVVRLEFFFGTQAAASGYDLSVRFSNGCEVSAAR